MISILVVEDDEKLNRIICTYLKTNGYNAVSAKSPVEAYSLLDANSFDMIISDVMMPNVDGFTFASEIRKVSPTIPILFITALDDLTSKRKGFLAGIDDYMVKPIDMDELVLRVGSILRRAKISNENTLKIGAVTLVKDEMTAYIDGKEVDLSPREFNVLFKLLSHPKKIFTRSELVDEYWGNVSDNGFRTVDVYVTKLRKLFASVNDFEIVTVHGFGYKAVIK